MSSLVSISFFFYRVAEPEFRTQPVTTAVSATGGVDTTPAQTHANAHFSRAQITVHNSYSTALFQCGHTALAQGEEEFVSRISSAFISISLDVSLLNVPFSRFPQVLSSPTCPTLRTSTTSTSFVGRKQNPCASAHWSGMSGRLADPTQHTGYEPNFLQPHQRGAHTDPSP